MGFDRPLALLSLAVLPALVAAYLLARKRPARYAVRYPNVDVLRSVAPRSPSRREQAVVGLVLLVLALLLVGVARPSVTRRAPVDDATVLLVVDVSRSMLARDVRPTRLGAAKVAAQSFLARAPKRIRVGIVTFAGDVSVTAFPTHDRELLRRSVATLGPFSAGRGGTAIGDALARAVEVARDAFTEPGGRSSPGGPTGLGGAATILFLSDGRQFRGMLQPGEGAALAKRAGIPVYTVALGTDGGQPRGQDPYGGFSGFGFNRAPDRPTLRAIAQTTGGEYFAARSAKALTTAYDDLGSRLGRAERRTEVTFVFVAAAALGLVAAVGLSRFWEPGLP